MRTPESNTMTDSEITPLFSDEEIQQSWQSFLSCEHKWEDEPEDSVFYKKCLLCGGAQGIKLNPNDLI